MISYAFDTKQPRSKIVSEFELSTRLLKMMKVEECGECNLKFHNIGTLSAKLRAKRHKRMKHTIDCENCGYKFVSTTHIAVHKYLSHDIECSNCGKTCVGHCLEPFTRGKSRGRGN